MRLIANAAACACLAFAHCAPAAEPPAKPAQTTPHQGIAVAHSAMLTVEAIPTDDSLELQIRRAKDQAVVTSDDVTVTIDGQSAAVTRQKDGSYLIPASDLRGVNARALDIVVAHDGIREVLSGTVKLPESSTASLWRDHKQMAWWILNIVIILVTAIIFSRRKS